MEQTDRRPLSVLHLLSLSFMITTTTIHSFISFSLSERESSSGVCNNNDDDFCCRCFCTTDWKTLRLPLLFFVCKRAANPTRVAAADQVLPPRVISVQLFGISEIIINSAEVIIILKKAVPEDKVLGGFGASKVLSSVCGLSTLFCGRRAFFRCSLFLLAWSDFQVLWSFEDLDLLFPLDKSSPYQKRIIISPELKQERRGQDNRGGCTATAVFAGKWPLFIFLLSFSLCFCLRSLSNVSRCFIFFLSFYLFVFPEPQFVVSSSTVLCFLTMQKLFSIVL